MQCCNFAIDLPGPGVRVSPGGFLVRPYLQLGDVPTARRPGTCGCSGRRRTSSGLGAGIPAGGTDAWRPADAAGDGDGWRCRASPAHRVYRADLKGLEPGGAFAYRVRRGDEVVFTAGGPRPEGGRPALSLRGLRRLRGGHRRGEGGRLPGLPGPARLPADRRRHRLHPRPDPRVPREVLAGLRRRRRRRRRPGRRCCARRSFVAAPGNHDVAGPRPGAVPRRPGLFLYWDQPLNGPIGREGGPLVPRLYGPEANRTAFLQAAGPAYPRMANFSFDYGNAHWTVLDSNPYVDWTDPDLRGWVERDLAAAQDATWRFVAFHHPPFNSSRAHFGDQRMRVLADVFEAGGVDIVWTGHVHNYQRTFPLTFRRRSAARRQAGPRRREGPRPMDARHVLRRPRPTPGPAASST